MKVEGSRATHMFSFSLSDDMIHGIVVFSWLMQICPLCFYTFQNH